MTINSVSISCWVCGERSPDVLVLRGTHLLVAMCGDCALKLPIVNERGEELRVVAVATDQFPAVILP